RHCGFCAIPSFRGPQRSRTVESILAEVEALGVQEVVLVAQDLASYGRDVGAAGSIVPLVGAVAERVPRVRLLYLYPSELDDRLVDTICATGVPYFDLSLQHVAKGLLRRMRRWGDGGRFLERIAAIRRREPDAAFRSSFIVGYPGETEDDHDALLRFVEEAQLDWAGFFAFSREDGTYAAVGRATAPGGVLRALGAGDARQRADGGPPVAGDRRHRPHRRPGRRLVDPSGLDRGSGQRRSRRMGRPPPGQHELRGVPRSAGRQGARARRPGGARGRGRVLVG